MTVTWNGIAFPLPSCPDAEAFPLRSKEIAFPGVDFIAEMDMGRGARRITVTGRFPDAKAGTPSAATILAIDTSTISTLVDTASGLTFPNCRVERARVFDWATVRTAIAGVDVTVKTARYEVVFKQLNAG